MAYTLFAESSTDLGLTACPFCSMEARVTEQAVFVYVECIGCGASTRLFGNRPGDPMRKDELRAMAIRAWNARSESV